MTNLMQSPLCQVEAVAQKVTQLTYAGRYAEKEMSDSICFFYYYLELSKNLCNSSYIPTVLYLNLTKTI